MGKLKFFQGIFLLGSLLCFFATLLFFKKSSFYPYGLSPICQNTNTYLGPEERLPNNSERIRIQILVYNDPNPKGVTIKSVSFNGVSIPLKPRDIYGFRGQASFQLLPKKYKLSWVVERNQEDWPRTLEREEEVFLDDRDFWIQITIVGEKAEIS